MTIDSQSTESTSQVVIVDKPWGQEEIWAYAEGLYCAKRITVAAGQSLSLQLHEKKHETMFVVSGAGSIDMGDDVNGLDRRQLSPGDVVVIPTGTVHRLQSSPDAAIVVMEASTTHLDDVVRLSDRYGRSVVNA